jgi:hypothetical protein
LRGDSILEVKKRYERSLLAIDGVVGVGIGETDSTGRRMPCIKVYVEKVNEELKKQIPETLDGFSVAMVQVGRAILY